MKFEANKKALASAASVVRTLTEAISIDPDAGSTIFLTADKKSLSIATVYGKQIVERVIRDIQISEEGSIALTGDSLQKSLSVSGDTFKLATDDKSVLFACGRAKGSLTISSAEPIDIAAAKEEAPDPVINAPGLRQMLRGVTIKTPSSGSVDRTLHFAKGVLRAESTDSMYGAFTVTKVVDADGKVFTGSVTLPAKAMDAVVAQLDEAAVIGVDDSMLSIRTSGLFVSMPLAATPPLDMMSQIDGMLDGQEPHVAFTVNIKDLTESISDALALSKDKRSSSLHLTLNAEKGVLHNTDEGSGKVESSFPVSDCTAAAATFKTQIGPALLSQCLSSFNGSVRIFLYDVMAIEPAADDGFLDRQFVMLPLASSVTKEDPKERKVVKKEAKPEPKPVEKPKAAKEEEDELPRRRKAVLPVDDEDEHFDDEA